MPESNINLVVAHKLEAKLFIDGYKLSRIQDQAYPIFGNNSGINLIVTGMGKENATAGCAYLSDRQLEHNDSSAAWLNVGIAGHKTAEVGAGLLINKITDRSSNKSYYPPIISNDYLTSALVTVVEPEFSYPENAAYDMEASAFYDRAQACVSSELVQVYKIISDNPANPVEVIDAKFINDCMQGRWSELSKLIAYLQELAGEFNSIYGLPSEVTELTKRIHFTVTQTAQLQKLCRRYYALGLAGDFKILTTGTVEGSRQIINSLVAELEKY